MRAWQEELLLARTLLTATRPFRRQGVTVFGVATANVLLFDTRGLETVARTVSVLVFGTLLLPASCGTPASSGIVRSTASPNPGHVAR